jgi:hypothetical protein
VILCAPSFGDAPSYDEIRPDLPVLSTRRELLFLEIALESLAPGGRCAIIVPESVLFSDGSTFVEVRARLFTKCEVLAVISLPSTIFRPYSAVKTSILVFRRPASGPPRIAHVWFYEVEHDGYSPTRSPQPEKNNIPELLTFWTDFAASAYMRPPGLEAASMRHPEDPSHCWWASRAAIEENRLDLSAKRYKPRFADPALRTPQDQFAQLAKARTEFVEGMDALYKSVAVDTLPHRWSEGVKYEKLGNLVDDFTGKTPSTTEPSYWGEAFPWVSPKDMKRYVIRKTQDHVTQYAKDKFSTAFVEKPEAVLVVVRSGILVHSVPIAVTAVPLMISQDIIALCPTEKSGIDAWYLFAYLKSVENLMLARTRVTGNGGRSLPRDVILDFDVPVPPSETCAQIGGAMRSYVKLVDAAEQIRADVGALFPAMLRNVFGL